MNIARQAELRDAIPNTFRPMGIVVARQQVPMNIGKELHALDRSAQRDRIRRFAIVDVACNEDMHGIVEDVEHTTRTFVHISVTGEREAREKEAG